MFFFFFRWKLLQICKVSYKSRKKSKLIHCKGIFVFVPCICTLITYCSLHREQEVTVQPQRQSQSNAVSMWNRSLQKLRNCSSSDLVQISAGCHAAPRRVGNGDSQGAIPAAAWASPAFLRLWGTQSKRKQPISKSIWSRTETGKFLSQKARDYGTCNNMNIVIYTDFSLSCFSFILGYFLKV